MLKWKSKHTFGVIIIIIIIIIIVLLLLLLLLLLLSTHLLQLSFHSVAVVLTLEQSKHTRIKYT
jgi:uncharacterized membrane protein